ncbi:MAG: hypothetical protein ACREMA_03750 [Longimicrobiales bacterium]
MRGTSADRIIVESHRLHRSREGTTEPTIDQRYRTTLTIVGAMIAGLNPAPQLVYAIFACIAIAALLFFPRREWFDALRSE